MIEYSCMPDPCVFFHIKGDGGVQFVAVMNMQTRLEVCKEAKRIEEMEKEYVLCMVQRVNQKGSEHSITLLPTTVL